MRMTVTGQDPLVERAKNSYVYGMLTSMRPFKFMARAVPGRVTSRDQPWIRCALLMYDNCSIPGMNILYTYRG